VPEKIDLYQNYPNPFNPSTRIQFRIPETDLVTINIYNIKGQMARQLLNEKVEAGIHQITWDGRDQQNKLLPSGIYFYRLNVADYEITKRMILLK
jgi:flagellar hook assembly protein FlgD